jgi:hypothetical protein
MNVNAFEGIVYLLIMVGIVGGPLFMMKMITIATGLGLMSRPSKI